MRKIVLVTGPTGAIGKATVSELAKNGCELILVGRNADKLNKLKNEVSSTTGSTKIAVIIADLSEPESVRKAAAEIRNKYSSLNGLINIAAIFKSTRFENSKGQEYMFATNHLGPFILTNELLDLLKAGKPARVVTVSAPSTTKINFDDIDGKKKFSAGFLGAFGASKMMNIMFTYALSRRLQGTGVTANVFHPGLVKSDLTKEMPAIINFIFKKVSGNPDKPAKMLTRLVLDTQFEKESGTFYKYDGKKLRSSSYSYNEELQEKLWKVSEQLSQTQDSEYSQNELTSEIP